MLKSLWLLKSSYSNESLRSRSQHTEVGEVPLGTAHIGVAIYRSFSGHCFIWFCWFVVLVYFFSPLDEVLIPSSLPYSSCPVLENRGKNKQAELLIHLFFPAAELWMGKDCFLLHPQGSEHHGLAVVSNRQCTPEAAVY